MRLKFLQLNIFQGMLLPEIIDFINQNDFDIIHLQEVTAGKMSKGGFNKYPDQEKREFNVNQETVGINCFEELKSKLSLDGKLVKVTKYKSDLESYLGNATLFKKKIKLVSKEVIWLHDFFKIDENYTDTSNLPRAALITKFQIGSVEITTINAHLAWGPDPLDENYKIEQAKKLYDRIKNIPNPFILSGDFNVVPQTKTASMFNDLGSNLIEENNITNTLNPRVHHLKSLFPKGLAVDYIFTSKDLKIKNFRVIDDVDLSDHFASSLEFEI